MKRQKFKHPRKLIEIPEAMKRLQFKRPKKLKIPDMEDDVEEIVRLMKRKPVEKEIDVDGCAVCGDKNHFPNKCPCLDKIPPGVVIGPAYDEVCIGCGKIGEICCSKGAYAVLRQCGACTALGHWYWDDRCSPNFRRPPWMAEIPSIEQYSLQDDDVVKVVKDNKNKRDYDPWDSFYDDDDDYDPWDDFYDDDDVRRPKKLKIPDMEDDVEEILRLKKRKPVEKEIDVDGCAVCGDKNHFPNKCPCLDKIPPGVVIGPAYDEVCIGCGKIGEICCSKGAYAVLRQCGACTALGHWYWDDRCSPNFRRPPWMAEIPSIEQSIREVPSTEQSLENSLQNKEEDEFMVNVGKDNKNEDEVAVLDDNGKEDESKGGNESSNQSRSEKKSCKAILEHAVSSYIYSTYGEKLSCQISQKLTQAAQQEKPERFGAGTGAQAYKELEEVDEPDVEPADIDFFMTQAGLSRSEIVKAVKSESGHIDIVRAIKELTT